MTLKNLSLCQWHVGWEIVQNSPELKKQYLDFISDSVGDKKLWYENSQFFIETYHELGIINIPEEKLEY